MNAPHEINLEAPVAVGFWEAFRMVSFGLENDIALARQSAWLRALDVGGEPAPKALGFEAILAGARSRIADGDALLAEMGGVLDLLYVNFQNPADQARA